MIKSNQDIWNEFITSIISGNIDKALELWEPKTRELFAKNVDDFRKKQKSWKRIIYKYTSDDYIYVEYSYPKGILPRLALSYNNLKKGKYSLCGRIIADIIERLKKHRTNKIGIFKSLCGIYLKRFAHASAEYRESSVMKRYALVLEGDKRYISWSYEKSIYPQKIEYVVEFETFILYSAVNCEHRLPMLKKTDEFALGIIEDMKITIPKINIFFHATTNDGRTGIPKSLFVAPGNNNICILNLRIQYDNLKHELLHAIIYAATKSWPPLFFREGFAEAYTSKIEDKELLRSFYNNLFFLTKDFTFFDYSEFPPRVSGILVRYLIDTYGMEHFCRAYIIAEKMSVRKALKKEYNLNIKSLWKKVMEQQINKEI